ncbi:MAG: hypothetical protein MI757_11470, partial [Pirellulales bacterium]|nr:hypothetical protein [Pirellulales bacterium]
MQAYTFPYRTHASKSAFNTAATVCALLALTAISSRADESNSEAGSAKRGTQVTVGQPTTADDTERNPKVESTPLTSVMKKPSASTAVDKKSVAPSAAEKKPSNTDSAATKPVAKQSPAKKTIAKVKLSRKPRYAAGPVITAATPYRYRHKTPGAEVIVEKTRVPEPVVPTKKPEPVVPRPPIVEDKPPMEVVKTPTLPTERSNVVAIPKTKPVPPAIEDTPKTNPPIDASASPLEELVEKAKPAAEKKPEERELQKIEVASFNGVQPGATTQEDLVRAWSNPVDTKSIGDRNQL